MVECRDEGVILKSTRFQDNHYILTTFTKHGGIIKLFVRHHLVAARARFPLINPLTRAELLFIKRPHSTLFRLKDGSILDPSLELRSNLDALQSACHLANALTSSQLLWKPSAELYTLFTAFLRQVGKSQIPFACLNAAFLLKLLKHEGLLILHQECTHCSARLLDAFLLGNEAYCSHHAPPGSLGFTQEERATLLRLAAARSFTQMQLPVNPSLLQKVEQLFTWLAH